MKSIINSEQVKKLVIEVVENALNECAHQQECNGEPYECFDCSDPNNTVSLGMMRPTVEMRALSDTPPTQLKLSFDFYFGTDTHADKRGRLVCQPSIDLTKIK
jgi:hypothetical protein